MTPATSCPGRHLRAALIAGVFAFALSACTTNDPSLQLSSAATPTVPALMAEAAADHTATDPSARPVAPHASGTADPTVAAADTLGGRSTTPTVPTTEASTVAVSPDDPPLPEQIAFVPTARPNDPFTTAMPALLSETADASGDDPAESTALPETAMIPEPNPAAAEEAATSMESAAQPTSAQASGNSSPATSEQLKHRGFFATLFSRASDPHAAAATSAQQPQRVASLAPTQPRPLIDPAAAPSKPIVDLTPAATSATSRPLGGADPLPGVRNGGELFEITRKSNIGDDSDVDINEEDSGDTEVASAAGMARIDPNGLLLQRDTVDTACLRPALLGVLKKIEAHYGQKLVVTSGYRSEVHNAAAHGALNSLHMFCAAADVQMPGVSKWELAAFARSMPGRGGVGTYCHTRSVHIDIGPERDWNWRCRRRRHRG